MDAGRWPFKTMANNYRESSMVIPIPSNRPISQVVEILARVKADLMADDEDEDGDGGYVGYCASVSVVDSAVVWIRHDESINVEHAEKLVKVLVEELDLPGIYVCSWADTCSRPRADAFGGGAFAVQKGRETVWIDAAEEARRQALDLHHQAMTTQPPPDHDHTTATEP